MQLMTIYAVVKCNLRF